MTETGYTGGQSYGRVIEPWLAELAVVVLAIILIGQGLRGHSTAFIFAGAIGLILGLTDFTSSYLGQPSEPGPVGIKARSAHSSSTWLPTRCMQR